MSEAGGAFLHLAALFSLEKHPGKVSSAGPMLLLAKCSDLLQALKLVGQMGAHVKAGGRVASGAGKSRVKLSSPILHWLETTSQPAFDHHSSHHHLPCT